MSLSQEELAQIASVVANSINAAMDQNIKREFEAYDAKIKNKFELILGVDCTDKEEREETHEDMKFLRMLRETSRKGGEKLFWWVLAIFGAGALAWFGLSPDAINKLTGHH